MPQRVQIQARLVWAGTAGIALLLGAIVGLAAPQTDEELAERLRDCARTEPVENRVGCLQSLANETILEENAPPKAPPAKDQSAKSTERRAEKAVIVETREKSITGVLSDCRKSTSGAYLFYLEDGQIWKQVDARKERFRKCDWPVTIVKAENGYRLLLDEDSYVLVRRLK